MTTRALLVSSTSLRAGRVGALYDLVATVGFVTPWTAALIFDLLRSVHATWDLPGEVLPPFDGPHMMFVNLFGAAVVMWSLARVARPVPWTVAIDTVGRLVFSAVFISVLSQGHSAVIVPFLALELAFLVWQALSLRVARAAEGSSVRLPHEPRPHDGRGVVVGR
ncbi:hypothetical protein [Actinotalea sp. K2]|uniref:hypothetical protein n=1 Tax=Actinotalea sp. K2 TaxID=2939438 RepID=UPI002018014B|nr:hypothetical protein [Actinotalea sp. K2]MCL3860808.1 hypothetical protein [Actinotalea sp. K2]